MGSPPRVRGKVDICFVLSVAFGITPACAGKRKSRPAGARRDRDHPRVCGEKNQRTRPIQRNRGSPPRVRGKVNSWPWLVAITGITPACAGKSCRRPTRTPARRDHPRVCGEKVVYQHPRAARVGSPPRVRGKGGVGCLHHQCRRITPACAGKSLRIQTCAANAGDHPRVCGEKDLRTVPTFFKKGSPPRVRGKERRYAPFGRCAGITPACAGKRLDADCGRAGREDHPRVCGEKSRPTS